jgi:hypothetical protein
MTDDRAERALTDVVAVERMAPGLVRVITWSDAWPVDARGEGCNCYDKEYNLGPGEKCKHEHGAMLAMSDRYPAPGIVTDNLSKRAVADGGERPDDCECDELISNEPVPCWPCARDGFETPAEDKQ